MLSNFLEIFFQFIHSLWNFWFFILLRKSGKGSFINDVYGIFKNSSSNFSEFFHCRGLQTLVSDLTPRTLDTSKWTTPAKNSQQFDVNVREWQYYVAITLWKRRNATIYGYNRHSFIILLFFMLSIECHGWNKSLLFSYLFYRINIWVLNFLYWVFNTCLEWLEYEILIENLIDEQNINKYKTEGYANAWKKNL